MKYLRLIFRWVNRARGLIPALFYFLHRDRQTVDADVARWTAVLRPETTPTFSMLVELLTRYPEFRNVFYKRVPEARVASIFCRPAATLFLNTKNIGEGLFIQHGFATIVDAKSIGRNCWINQQVTIGYSGRGRNPTIGNNVSIRAGAKVVGAVTVGDNVIIGANAVVVKDVPPNCTVVGVPARIVRKDGVRVDIAL